MLNRFRLGRKSVKEKGIATAVMAAVIVVIVAVAGIGAYFLMKGPVYLNHPLSTWTVFSRLATL